jgi:hypothetical protein
MAGLAASVALAETFLLGTFGWFAVSLALGRPVLMISAAVRGSCAPCAKAHAWVIAGGAGQWVLARATVVMLVLGLRRPGWRRAATAATCVLIPVAGAWFAITAGLAQRAF